VGLKSFTVPGMVFLTQWTTVTGYEPGSRSEIPAPMVMSGIAAALLVTKPKSNI
jgi:hypothetical protein